MHLVEQTTVRYAVNGISASHNNNSKPYGKRITSDCSPIQATFAVPCTRCAAVSICLSIALIQ